MNTELIIKEIRKFGLICFVFHVGTKLGICDDFSLYKKKIPYYASLSQSARERELSDWYQSVFGVPVNYNSPDTFTQWIQWSKLYDCSPMKTRLADKYLVREWVREKIGSKFLVPLLGVWDTPERIPFDELPNQFVLKANHGCGMTIVVEDKKSIDIVAVKKKLALWLSAPFGWEGMELHYINIPRKIIAEQYIVQGDGDLCDYKIHCFGGEPRIIQVIGNRTIGKHEGLESFYNIDWTPHLVSNNAYTTRNEALPRPEKLDELLFIAKKLSEGFPYVRVDLYLLEDGIKFGEMTFTPTNGISKWQDKEFAPYLNQIKAPFF